MSSNILPNALIILVGPTGVGKTALSLQVAEEFQGEIVSADSRLLYRGMDIATAKPTLEERLRIPHHLIDIANPDQLWSLARYQEEAYQVIRDIQSRDKYPFLVGGTGQYIRAIIEGWQPPILPPDQKMRKALLEWSKQIGSEGLHSRLEMLDPDAAKKIDYRNVRRTIRALEVIFGTGRRFSEQREKDVSPFTCLVVGLNLPREELYRRIDARIDLMIDDNLIEEVKQLLSCGYGADLPTMSAIGYAEIAAYIHGNISLEEAILLMRRRTRKYIRRQAAWFRKDDPSIHWFDANRSDTLGEILELIRTPSRWASRA
jgi:tRNA dimethylallyltransferase